MRNLVIVLVISLLISQYLIVSKIGEKKSEKKNLKLEYPAISAFKFRISHRYLVP